MKQVNIYVYIYIAYFYIYIPMTWLYIGQYLLVTWLYSQVVMDAFSVAWLSQVMALVVAVVGGLTQARDQDCVVCLLITC